MTRTDKTLSKSGVSHDHGETAMDAALSAAVAAHVAAYHAAPAPTPPAGPTPTLDITFDSGIIDPRLVSMYQVGDPGYGWDSDFLGNLSQCVIVNGALRIKAERKPTPSGRPYASACPSTYGTWSQLYGTFEARLRYDNGQGVWPAFWMKKDRSQVPPEIDILEAYPGNPAILGGPQYVTQTNHWAGEPADPSLRTDSWELVTAPGAPDLTKDFHTHRLVWTPSALVFSIDGVETSRVTTHMPNVPMYPILTLAMGAGGYRVDATTPSTVVMDIDYLRAWAA